MKFIISFLFLCSLIFANEIQLKEDFRYIPVLERSKYFIDKTNKLQIVDILKIDKSNWISFNKNLESFGFESEAIWIKIELENLSKKKELFLTSEYAWIDYVDFYETENGMIINENMDGDSVPFALKKNKFKLPTHYFTIEEGQKKVFYVSFSSLSEKLVAISLETKEEFFTRNYFYRDFFFPYALVTLIVVFINVIIYLRTKSNLVVLYTFMILGLLSYTSVLTGFAYEFLFPNSTFIGDTALYSLGYAFMFFFLQFWRKFLFLDLYLPKTDKLFSIVCYVGLLIVLSFLVGFLNHFFLELAVRIYLLFMTIASISTSIYVYRQNFQPALYSIIGLPIAFIFSLIFYLSGIGDFSGNEFTKNCILYGFMIEFLVFFYSISARTKFLTLEVQSFEAVNTNQLEFEYFQKVKKSRNQSIETNLIINKIYLLMNEEKLFCDEDLKLTRLAELVNIRADQLSELINTEFNKSYSRFINEFRVEEAKKILLTEKDRNILSIALAVGFNSKSSFNTEFKRITGITPTEFRNNISNQAKA
ncbi:MAG: helix-turn-helix domain-containing protein [Leptospiraceae bacterium]|nr:helix-turn-helix domain-containing protein [Leptospiraceae bacterium]